MREYYLALRDISIAFKKASTSFFLADGTALTAYREKKPVEWDKHDIDINVKIEDWTEEKDAIIEKEMCERGWQKQWATNNPLPYLFQHRYDKGGIHIDVFTWHRKGEYYWRTTYQGAELYLPYVLPAKYFDELSLIKYCGITLKISKDIENYLTLAFGKDWRTPLNTPYNNSHKHIKAKMRYLRMVDWINGKYDEERYLTESWFV